MWWTKKKKIKKLSYAQRRAILDGLLAIDLTQFKYGTQEEWLAALDEDKEHKNEI